MQYCKCEYIKEKETDLSVCKSAYGFNFSIAHDLEKSLEQTLLKWDFQVNLSSKVIPKYLICVTQLILCLPTEILQIFGSETVLLVINIYGT